MKQFPSKVELQRSIAYGGADAKGDGVPLGTRLQFEEWQEKEEGFLLPKVWVRVMGFRKPLREFLNLWAVGSLLGSTQTVDMETTRKSDFGRIFVAVLDPKLIPRKLDVVIGDHYFELEFEVEKEGFDESGEEVDIFWEGDEGGNEEESEEPGMDSDARRFNSQKEERNNKRFKGGGEEKREGAQSVKEVAAEGGRVLGEEFQEFLRWKANKVLDKSVEVVMEEITAKVMEEVGTFKHATDSQVVCGSEFQGEVEGVFEMEVYVDR